MTPETQLVNVDSERTVYLKDIDNALKWTYKKTYKGLNQWWDWLQKVRLHYL
jgi:hypothetical protein